MSLRKITITGDLGSGKSVVSKVLKEKLGFPIVSTGTIQRAMAAELGVSTLELNRLAETDPSIDQKIDAASIALNDEPEPFISDSRMSWFFIKDALKIYLKVDPKIAAARIFGDENRFSEAYENVEEAFNQLGLRRAAEIERFIEKYGVDYTDLGQYDLIIDTGSVTPEEVASVILARHACG
ncbi:cytidylate kinase family protein [Lewinella sp. 4G2]|uniref:cytidylate kinase family protein n=1 Tax=Lewinella sp. 4G2 TaxID=1803372 RepID=UPI0007B46300|nr:cytidylate kinase family protein [Lewinella sp. 4G2]OAV43407.1 hypothetical protein A3850_002350 [Lewinella sp. 4G2]